MGTSIEWYMGFARAARAGLIAACLSAASVVAHAQDTTSVQRGAWAVGGSIGLPGYATRPEPKAFTIGVHGTQVQPGRLGADIYAGVLPYVLTVGMLAVAGRGGLVLPLAVSEDVLLLPSGGASVIGAFGAGGAGAQPGLNIGATALVFNEGSTGFRASITWHRFRGANAGIWLVEIGFVRQQ